MKLIKFSAFPSNAVMSDMASLENSVGVIDILSSSTIGFKSLSLSDSVWIIACDSSSSANLLSVNLACGRKSLEIFISIYLIIAMFLYILLEKVTIFVTDSYNLV